MKKLLLIAMMAVGLTVTAQEGQTSKGKFVIEANTGSATTGNTSFSLASSNGTTNWSIGLDGGYFVMDDLAIKAGLGYLEVNGSDAFNYKIGAEYFILSKIPVSVDFTGSTGNDLKWLGLQAGYALFLADNIALKPAVRYNVGLDNQDGVFQGLVGFSLFL